MSLMVACLDAVFAQHAHVLLVQPARAQQAAQEKMRRFDDAINILRASQGNYNLPLIAAGSAMLAPLGLYGMWGFHPGQMPPAAWVGAAYLGLVASVVMYLNTPRRGGGTVFPDVQFEVAPIKGNAVFFSYDRPDPITRSLHGGSPVIEGEKWVATKWLRERRFE